MNVGVRCLKMSWEAVTLLKSISPLHSDYHLQASLM